ncbi:MAG: DNA cytosine methyltransferase [Rickettsiaceae bacterium]|nr:DNA cytosine methyltransferase [Rickettsiaceae bacterium]
MKILNLYAGIGGNRKLWGDEHEIIAVENNANIAKIYQDHFPKDKVIVADAHQYLLEHYKEFDFIWSSPPCPTHSRARFGLGVCSGKVKPVYPDMRLYQEIIFLDKHFKGKWVVENVMAYYKPLIEPKKIGRHWYWTNFEISEVELKQRGVEIRTSRISQQSKEYSKSPVRIYKAIDYEKLYGFDLSKHSGIDKRLVLRNCVEPEVGKYILANLTKLRKE